jgi:sec-independent protein translocase protein TatA
MRARRRGLFQAQNAQEIAGWQKRGCVIESTVELPEKTMDLFAPTHLLVLLLIVLIIFGPSKLGDVGGALGKAVKDFKKAINDEPDPKPVVKAEDTKPLDNKIS